MSSNDQIFNLVDELSILIKDRLFESISIWIKENKNVNVSVEELCKAVSLTHKGPKCPDFLEISKTPKLSNPSTSKTVSRKSTKPQRNKPGENSFQYGPTENPCLYVITRGEFAKHKCGLQIDDDDEKTCTAHKGKKNKETSDKKTKDKKTIFSSKDKQTVVFPLDLEDPDLIRDIDDCIDEETFEIIDDDGNVKTYLKVKNTDFILNENKKVIGVLNDGKLDQLSQIQKVKANSMGLIVI